MDLWVFWILLIILKIIEIGQYFVESSILSPEVPSEKGDLFFNVNAVCF